MSYLLTNPNDKAALAQELGASARPAVSGSDEMVQKVRFSHETPDDGSTVCTVSSDPHISAPPYPEDSLIHDWVLAMREFSEAPDSFSVGSLLPVLAAALGRRVWMPFAGKKYANLYSMIVARPGMRKSTTIGPARFLAEKLLPEGALYSGNASEEALFKAYQTQPSRLFIEDEGNAVLRHWGESAPGKQVAKRMLKLYDFASWEQAYLRQESDNAAGDSRTVIDSAGASMLLGATYNCCRFNGLDERDGMQRRVNYYFADKPARRIYLPGTMDFVPKLAVGFSIFKELEGTFADLRSDPALFKAWCEIQDDNRERESAQNGFSSSGESALTVLAEVPAKTLKFAMLFEIARQAKSRGCAANFDWRIRPDTLRMAYAHARAGIEAFGVIQTIGERAEIRDAADGILATIRTEFAALFNPHAGAIILTKSQLTARFAANTGRRNARTTEDLYHKILPDLIRRGLAADLGKSGNLHRYAFPIESA